VSAKPSGAGALFFAAASSRARLARRFVRQDFGVALAGEVELGALCFACRRLRMIARALFTCCTCDFFGDGFVMKDCPLVMDAVGPFIARPNSPVSLAPVWGLSGVRVSAIQAFPSAIRQVVDTGTAGPGF